MKQSVDIKQLQFYLWVTLLYSLIWLFTDLSNYPEMFGAILLNSIWRAGFIIVINFIVFQNTLPYIRRKRKYFIYNILLAVLAFWALLMLYSVGMYAWRSIGVALHIYTPLANFITMKKGIAYGTPYGIASFFFFGIIKLIYDNIKLKQATQQLQIEKQQAELNYLKSQTNPHFLFNTLNNIYSLARDKSDLAPESILRLSKILRFMLYETTGEFIAIEQELKIISDYIALEQLRYDESLRISFNHDIEDMRQAIPPLLLVPLVENAFKHGVSETRNEPFIDIHLSVNKRQLTFVVKNSSDSSDSTKENIGLSNLRRQLELLYKDYDLSVQQTGSLFTATLKINLASHV